MCFNSLFHYLALLCPAFLFCLSYRVITSLIVHHICSARWFLGIIYHFATTHLSIQSRTDLESQTRHNFWECINDNLILILLIFCCMGKEILTVGGSPVSSVFPGRGHWGHRGVIDYTPSALHTATCLSWSERRGWGGWAHSWVTWLWKGAPQGPAMAAVSARSCSGPCHSGRRHWELFGALPQQWWMLGAALG